MVTELQSEQRELAEYIRAGSTRGPQCFGSYFDEKGGSCALGAVYDAVLPSAAAAREADS